MNVKMWKLWNLLLLSVGNVSSDFSRQLIRLTTKCKLFLGQWLPSQLRSVVSGSAPLRRGLSSRQTWSGRNSRSFLWPFQWNYKMLVMGVSCPALNVAELPKLLNVAPEARKTVTSPPSPLPRPMWAHSSREMNNGELTRGDKRPQSQHSTPACFVPLPGASDSCVALCPNVIIALCGHIGPLRPYSVTKRSAIL